MSKTTSSISMTHVACESKLRSIVRPSVHPRPGNLVAIRSAVVYYVRDARAFSAGIKCRHCIFSCILVRHVWRPFYVNHSYHLTNGRCLSMYARPNISKSSIISPKVSTLGLGPRRTYIAYFMLAHFSSNCYCLINSHPQFYSHGMMHTEIS